MALLGVSAIVLSVAGQDKPSTPAIRSVPVAVNPSNTATSIVQSPSAPKATQASPPARPPAPVISEQKLTDARKIIGNLANGRVKVIVNLSLPPELAGTDFASRTSLEFLRPKIRQLQQDVLDNLSTNDIKVGIRFDNIAGFSAEVTTNGLKALQAHSRVVSIEPVFTLEPHLAQGIPLIHGMTYRSNTNYSGAGLAIAICDSGIDYTHARLGGGDFQSTNFPNTKVIGGYDFGDGDTDPIPNTQAHGTWCAGVAAGDLGTVDDYIGGVAYAAMLYALKITSGTNGSPSNDAMVAAWDWCVTHQYDNTNFPIMVISTSAGIGRYLSECDSEVPSMTAAANRAVAAGITVVVSSGNDGYCDSINWPACIASVISVGSVYDAAFGLNQPCVSFDSCAPKNSGGSCGWYADDLTAPDKVLSSANVASLLTLMAPGDKCDTLNITGPGGVWNGDYFPNFGGTSAACAYAAGAVACLQSAAKAITGHYLTPQQVRNRLVAYGDNVTDTKVAITKPRVNLERAIQSLGLNPDLYFVSATLNGGNGNQTVDPNECNNLQIVIRNDGSSTATNISATLTTTTPGLNVVQSNSIYPNLATNVTATNVTLFQISTAPSFVCGTPVNLTLTVAYVGGTNTLPFSLMSGGTNYVITQSTGAGIVPGTTDVGNHGDDTISTINLPFAYTFYGQTFSNAALSANGNLQFATANGNFDNICLPTPYFGGAIFAHWDDLRTDGTVGSPQGIFTSTSGTAPNRIFNIEWRASYFSETSNGSPVNFEVRLYEGQQRFDIMYGTLNGAGTNATVGAQKGTDNLYAQFECNTGGLSNGLQLTFQQSCSDVAVFLSAAVSGGNIALMFDTVAGLTYVVEYKDSLTDPTWHTLQSVPGDCTKKTITVSNSTPSRRFYRLNVQ